ncbi:MurR/RpiR family transcriptional regulator [Enterococcus sp. AZ109]|uniref:MurR/RpiR family transcriptional regulator n=1 Tax=Enterococcus sp. AZ109 TaxID=2774634 RepID=UPI003F26BA13
MDAVYSQIQKHYDELSSTEQLAIDYILDYQDLDNLKLKIIEEALHISAPTIIRAVKKLNFRTFTEFKYALIATKQKEEQALPEQSYENMLQTMASDFDRTLHMMDKEKLMTIAKTILASRRIFCIGIGSSATVVNSFNHKLKNFGLWSNDYSEVFPIRDIPDVAKNEDCIVVFSLSGSEEQLIEVITACKVTGCKIITVTSLSSNALANLSNIALMIHQSPQQRKKMRSRLMLSVASEIIFETLLLVNDQQESQQKNTAQAMK